MKRGVERRSARDATRNEREKDKGHTLQMSEAVKAIVLVIWVDIECRKETRGEKRVGL